MTARRDVDAFLERRKLAIVGVSRSGQGFGNSAYKELKTKGYQIYPVHPEADMIDGERCYPSLKALPEPVEGVLIVLPPQETEKVVQEAAEAGIRHVWMQQGAESVAAIRFCEEQGINAVHGECVLMFAEPTAFFHRMHRCVWGLLGRLPE
jgi:hypothetical protein